MWAVVGLGNPGAKYSKTRHNAGFMVIDEIASSGKIEFKEKKNYSYAIGVLGGVGAIDGSDAVLIKPLTFMNLSGLAVRDALKRFGIPPDRLIVVHDDMDMEAGKLKIKKGGSSGGHNGVESVIQSIGVKDFIRVKIGIGRDPALPSEVYVLSKFSRPELPAVKEAVSNAALAVSAIINEGLPKAMNKFNRNIKEAVEETDA